MSEGSEADAGEQALPWALATLEDVAACDFESPIAGEAVANCRRLSDHYDRARVEAQAKPDIESERRVRVFGMLGGVLGMRLRRDTLANPYSAALVLQNSRSAEPQDFAGAPLAVLSYMAERAMHPPLRARLCDVCWLLDRKRFDLARSALVAYSAVVEGLDNGTLRSEFDAEHGALSSEAEDALRRGLHIGRRIGWDKEEVRRCRDLTIRMREKALQFPKTGLALRYSRLDLETGCSEPAAIAQGIENYLKALPDGTHTSKLELWRLAGRAYRAAEDTEAANRCQLNAAEDLLVQTDQAEKHGGMMLAAHWLGMAIAELHGLPDIRERRKRLRQRLLEVQSHLPDEMGHFEYPMDLEPVVEKVESYFARLGLLDALFALAATSDAPNLEKLRASAQRAKEQTPLSSLFERTYLDRDGKTVHRGGGGPEGEEALQGRISQHESIRRHIHAASFIEVARRTINDRFYLELDVFRALVQPSPFVPPELHETYATGFARFFEGDIVSAVHILTPMLESSLRYVLKLNDYDVTTFDDATQTQEDRTISQLFAQMREELTKVFGETLVLDMEHTFLKPPGPALRHAVAHGLLGDSGAFGPDAVYGCWLIFRLCCLPLLPRKDDFQSLKR